MNIQTFRQKTTSMINELYALTEELKDGKEKASMWANISNLEHSMHNVGKSDIENPTYVNRIYLNRDGDWLLEGNIIDRRYETEVFEQVDYKLVEVEGEIDNLITWIGESTDYSNTCMMKDDLEMLMENKDKEFCFSSLSTNDYVFEDESSFNDLVAQTLVANQNVRVAV